MATQYFTGRGASWPDMAGLWGAIGFAPTLSTALLIDASTEQAAMAGRLWWPGTATSKNIEKVHIRLGAVTAGTATFRVSLQDIDTANGPPIRPDGNVDENATIATSSLTANAVNSFTLSATRAVTRGQLLAVVFDYSAFTSGASVVISGLRTVNAQADQSAAIGGVCLLNTASWALSAVVPNVVFEFNDGTFGGFYVNTPFSAINGRGFANNTAGSGGLNAGKERGLEFTVPVPTPVDGCWLALNLMGNTTDPDIVLYAGTNPLETVPIDANTVATAGNNMRNMLVPFSQVHVLAPGTTYRLVVKPSTTSNVTLATVTLAAAGHRVLWHGTNAAGNSSDGSTFGTADTTELPLMALSIAGGDDGAGGGGSAVGYRSQLRVA